MGQAKYAADYSLPGMLWCKVARAPFAHARIVNIDTSRAEKLPGVKVRIGRLSDFADRLLAEKPDLPVIRGDMPDTWIHGPMADPAGARLARNTRPAIAAAELLNTQMRAWGVAVPVVATTIASAYEHSLL